MNKLMKTGLYLTLLLLVLMNPLMAHAERIIKVGLYDFKPLIFKNDKGEPSGLFIDVLNHVAGKKGWQLTYVYGTWKETYQALLDGQLDLVPCIGFTEARKKQVDFSSDQIFLDWGVIYGRPGSGIENFHDLKNKRVAVLSGSVYTEGLKQTLLQFDIASNYVEMQSYRDIFRAIEQKEVDAGISTNLTGLQFEKEFGASRTPIIFTPVKLAYAVKKERNIDLLEALDREVAVLKSDKKSLYYDRYDYWITSRHGGSIPRYVQWSIAVLLVSGLFLIFWNIVLKRQVKTKTAHLELEITKRKHKEEDLLDKNAVLESFTYTVSHDLKSPLITIQSYAGMIEQDMAEGNQARAQSDLKRIMAAASKMTHLLDDLLRLSRVGKLMSTPAQVDMNRLVRNVMSQLADSLELQQIEVVVQSELPAVHGDQRRIEEVLQNLVENAIKYKRDQARPSIEIGTREELGKHVYFVQDNGIGIDERYHQTIFGLFNKLDAKSEGTGIGLALVKRIIEVHGGLVWVESEGAGKGSRFCFMLGQNL